MADDVVFDRLHEDETFNTFLSEDFDAKSYATQAIQNQGLAISQQLAKLAEGINLLDKEIHSQVVAHHEDLLSQATSVETLEGVLQMMQTRIQSLLAAVERVRGRITEPYNKIVTRTAQLRRLQETCDLLRRIIQIFYLSRKLHTQIQGGAREITKAAQSLNELDYLSEGVDLSGIEVLEADRRFIKQARKDVETQAQRMLAQGMETQNQSQVATSLQVFHNLGSLHVTVRNIVTETEERLHAEIKAAVDVRALSQSGVAKGTGGPGRASMPVTGNTAQFRASLWSNMEKLMDSIYASCAQIQHLQKVLAKKRDPVTHVCFIDELSKEGDVNILRSFWVKVTEMLGKEFGNAAVASTFLKQAFESEYPKLLRLYNDLWRRLTQFSSGLNVATPSTPHEPNADGVFTYQEEEATDEAEEKTKGEVDAELLLRNTLEPFENAYLSRSLSRLFDPINLVFTAGSFNPPTVEEVDGIVKTISSELSVASVDARLGIVVAKNVAKTVQLFCVKSEQLLSTDGEASQVIGPQTPGQNRNAEVVNMLFYLYQSVGRLAQSLSHFPVEAIEAVAKSLEAVVTLMGTSMRPLLCSVADSLEAIILTMHNEDFSSPAIPDGGQADAPCSLYMRELQQFIIRVQSTYLTQFSCTDFVMDCILPIAAHALELFLTHAGLVRPLGEGGKMRLAADFAQMELAISPFCRKLGELGKPYKMLRAFRPMLFMNTENLVSSSALGEVVPFSYVLHFLYARAPQEMKSPHQAAGWSISRYSQWLEDHKSEKDRLTLIKGSLESYAQATRARGDDSRAPIYSIMLDLLKRGVEWAYEHQ